MKGFLQEYGIIMVVVAVVLGMLAFGKAGYAKSIQNAILGSADHIVETGDNITKSDKKEVNVIAGDMLDIEGTKYVVLEKQGNYQALVMTASSIGRKAFQSKYTFSTKLRPDGQRANTYEGSDIDNYLENDWYNSLSSTMKAAIQTTNIKQASYSDDSPDTKQETGYNGQVYNTISRHTFLPSVSEIGKAVDLKNQFCVNNFLKGTTIQTRDSSRHSEDSLEMLNTYFCKLGYTTVSNEVNVRPAFVVDLSKVDYTVAGHENYK